MIATLTTSYFHFRQLCQMRNSLTLISGIIFANSFSTHPDYSNNFHSFTTFQITPPPLLDVGECNTLWLLLLVPQ